jgi:hypothetical protein
VVTGEIWGIRLREDRKCNTDRQCTNAATFFIRDLLIQRSFLEKGGLKALMWVLKERFHTPQNAVIYWLSTDYDYNKTNLIEWVKYLHAKSEETEEKKQVREDTFADMAGLFNKTEIGSVSAEEISGYFKTTNYMQIYNKIANALSRRNKRVIEKIFTMNTIECHRVAIELCRELKEKDCVGERFPDFLTSPLKQHLKHCKSEEAHDIFFDVCDFESIRAKNEE